MTMPKEHLNPHDLFPSLQYGFSQIVTATPGRMVFLSGQVAWDAQQNLIGGKDLKAQTLQALRNVEKALGTAGASLTDIVAMRLYVVDYASQQGQQITEALNAVFSGQPPPACTWIGVAALADEGFLIEIEATAVIEEEEV
ncbi:MAG: RidA family protein [Xenococcaceae cyanobacterium]